MEVKNAVQSYFLDCESRGLSIHTMRVYIQRLQHFSDFLTGKGVSDTEQLTADQLRQSSLAVISFHGSEYAAAFP